MLREDKFIYQISSQYLKKRWSLENWSVTDGLNNGEQIKSPIGKQVRDKYP